MARRLSVAQTRALNGKVVKDSSVAVTGATNATPIVVTSVAHGLQTGDTVWIIGANGNVGANGVFPDITVNDANTFTLNGIAGSGPYTSGGFATRLFVGLTFSDISDIESLSGHLSVKRGGSSELTVKAIVEAQTTV